MFDPRAERLEILDGTLYDERFAERCYRFMSRVNRFLGGARVVRRFLEEEVAAAPGRPLRVLDIGAGACDIPLAVARWARRRGLDLAITCLEPAPLAARIARRNLARAGLSGLRLLEEDVFAHQPSRPYDCAIGSMFFHHLRDDEIVRLVEHLRRIVRRSVLLNDLRRTALHFAGAVLLTALACPGLRHDALVSIRRGFRVADLQRTLGRIHAGSLRVENAWLFRIRAIVQF